MTAVRIIGAILVALVLLFGIAWYGLLHTEAGARWLWTQAESATGGALAAREIHGDLGSGVSLEELSFVAGGVHVTAASATVDATLNLLPLTVSVGTAHVTALTVSLPESRPADPERETGLFRLEFLQLPFELSIANLQMDDASLVREPQKTLVTINHATLAAHWQDSIRIEDLDLRMPGIGVRGNAGVQLQEPYDIQSDLQVRAQPEVTGLRDPVAFRIAAGGPLDDFTIEAEADEPRAQLGGRIADIRRSIRWDVEFEILEAVLPPEANMPDAPPVTVSGASAGGMKAFSVNAAVSASGTDSTARLNANIDIASQAIEGSVDWTALQWPLAGAEPRIESRRGTLDFSGSAENWAAKGTVQLATAGLPPGQLRVDGTGNREEAVVKIVEGDVLGGSVAGRARYSWQGQSAYSASLDLKNVETQGVFPDWPATLSGHVDLRGQQSPFAVSIVLDDVEGQFLNQPLRAEGGIGIRNGAVSADELSVAHGESLLRVNGNPYASGGLRYQLSVADLANYSNDAFGMLTANGVLSLRSEIPYLEIEASSPELGFRDGTIFDLEIANQRRGNELIDIELVASGVQYGKIIASDVRLGATGDKQQQSVELEFATDGLKTLLALDGALDDWNAPGMWQGQLMRLQLEHAEFNAALSRPAAIELTGQSVSVGNLCIDSDRGASLCSQGSWGRNSGARLSADLASVPAGLVNAFAQTGFRFDQMLSGLLDWRMATNGRSSGLANVSMSSGTIVSVTRPDLKLETGAASLRFRIDNNSLHSGVLNLPMPGLGQVAAQFDVLDVAGDGSAALQGTIDVDVADVQFVEALIPALDDIKGRLTANLFVSGSVSQPVIMGDFALDEGAVSYGPIGLDLTQLSLDGEVGTSGNIEMTGSFMAGDGRGRIRTRTNQLQTLRSGLQIELQGDNLTLIDVPDLRAVANTDVTVGFDGETLQLHGKVDVPYARIKPQNIGINRVSESDDVVVVRGELPDGQAAAESDTVIYLNGTVELSLGEDVVVELDVADAYLSGSTVFSWNGPPMPVADGRYILNGEILAYGQNLKISEGAIRFPNVPASDPYLRIRAEREIFGNTQVRRAGVLVSGSARRPTIEAYTTPMTTEERALTLLVTGSEFDYEKGVGAFDFGTYVAPRVYASYGIGLFDQANVIRVRYDLTEGFGVTLTSGARDEGVDLTYRISN